MQLRKFVLVCSLASFALSNFASALGLGEITLNSTLNEPLSAEVKLVDTRDLSSDQILVALASPADFERNGIDRLYFYTELQFQVLLNNPGGPIVRITTRNPVREPYLNFLLEARWTAGRLLREYTVLMDLPTFDETVPQPVQAAETSRSTVKESRAAAPAEPVQQSQPQPAIEEAAQSSIIDEPSVPYANEKPTVEEKPAVIAEQDQSAKKFEAGTGTYGPVSKKDTLWEIAKAVRPNSKTSIHQTMLALQRLNPNAFIHGNINLIKKGQVLRVPDANEISSVPKSAAMSMVAAQNDAWASAKASMAGNTTELGAQLDASSNAPRDRTQTETVSGRVKLETPLSADAGDGGQGRGAKKGAGKALESELSSTLEELDKSKFEKSELSSRVKDLEEQAKTMQKLTEASNEKLRAMQLNAAKLAEAKAAAAAEEAKLAEQKSVSSIAAVTDPVPETVIAPAAVDPAAPIVSAEASSVEASAAASIAASSVSAPALPEKKAARVVAEKSIVDTVLENLWVVLVAAGFIGVAVFMIRRRKFEAAMPPSRFNNDNEDLYSSEPNFDNFNEEQEQYELEAEPEQEDEVGLFEEDEVSAVAETGDVVGEADIYIAYGKFDQAEEMLLNGLAKDPHSSDIRLKLLEVYSQTQNAVEFDKHYAALLPIASEFTKNRASELRANIAGVSAFAAVSTVMQPTFSAPSPTAEVEDEFSFDLDDDATVVNYDKTQIKSAPSNATTQRYSLDFDDAPVASAKGISLDDDFSLDLDSDSDFNLDLDTSKNKAEKSEAEDLSEISLALDGLDDEIIDDDLDVAEVDEEFSFDFNELDAKSSNLTAKENTGKASQVTDANADDFNLELDMNDIDLAALDHEMEGLDADLESLDFDEVKPAGKGSTAKLLDNEEEINWAEDDDLDLGSSTSSLASLNDAPVSTAYKPPQSSLDDEIADDVFDQALSDFSADNLNATDADMSDADLDSELDFMADADESATKLDLARAYIDMGDNEGARDILAEVAHEGNDQQRQEAVDLLSRIDV